MVIIPVYPDTSQHLVRHTNLGGSFSGNVGGNWCKRVLSQLVKGMRTTCPRDGTDPSRGSKNKKKAKKLPHTVLLICTLPSEDS